MYPYPDFVRLIVST